MPLSAKCKFLDFVLLGEFLRCLLSVPVGEWCTRQWDARFSSCSIKSARNKFMFFHFLLCPLPFSWEQGPYLGACRLQFPCWAPLECAYSVWLWHRCVWAVAVQWVGVGEMGSKGPDPNLLVHRFSHLWVLLEDVLRPIHKPLVWCSHTHHLTLGVMGV